MTQMEMTQMDVLEAEHGKKWRAYQGGAKEFERRRRICDAIRARIAAVGEDLPCKSFSDGCTPWLNHLQPATAEGANLQPPVASSSSWKSCALRIPDLPSV
jgi:hypothetical protein